MSLLYLALRSNHASRPDNLRQALRLLRDHGVENQRLSPLLEAPSAPPSCNPSYLTLVVEALSEQTPAQLQHTLQTIQAPFSNALTTDILLWGDEIIRNPDLPLSIPHPRLHQRYDLLTPLLHLQPNLVIPGLARKTLFEWSQDLPQCLPLWMGIVNLTPDSFSDGAQFQHWPDLESQLDAMCAAGVHIIDLGAESTRPDATPLSASEEWMRLAPVLERLKDKFQADPLRPRLSIDTYHPETAARALDWGADIINDVGGLLDPAMIELAKTSGKQCDWIAMHQLTLPADRNITLAQDCDPVVEVENWLRRQLETWDQAGLDCNRIIFDPGIGFGKTSWQSLQLLRQAGDFRRHGLRVLIGHSRKSFMQPFTTPDLAERDLATVGASLQLCQQGVDILRVHNVPAHVAAYRGWSHCASG